jgi:hypothetical protein
MAASAATFSTTSSAMWMRPLTSAGRAASAGRTGSWRAGYGRAGANDVGPELAPPSPPAGLAACAGAPAACAGPGVAAGDDAGDGAGLEVDGGGVTGDGDGAGVEGAGAGDGAGDDAGVAGDGAPPGEGSPIDAAGGVAGRGAKRPGPLFVGWSAM